TAAGLTAAVLREKGGGMILEAGAMVMADRGVCCIDEIDKMRPEDRVAIHEAMAQQTVSVAKGGIVATLNARTAVMAAANPSLGRYDSFRTFPENINLPVTILSRFDLIFTLKDVPDAEQDRKISDHILSLHSTGAPSVSPPIPPKVLRKYASYAKRIRPEMTPEAMKTMEDFFLATRAVYDQTSTVSITARQLESLIRLAEARARAAMRETVTVEDAGAVVMLMKKSLSQVGVDVTTGAPDIDIIMTGKPRSVREKLGTFMDMVKRLSEEKGVAEEEALKRDLLEQGLTEAEIDRILRKLIAEGTLYSPRPGAYKVT
ncbi:MAG: ATP-binding protein, partial [Nitrososphaeria archaeon]